MTERELFQKAFSPVHAPSDTVMEVLNMANKPKHISKTGRVVLIAAVCAVLLVGGALAGGLLRLDERRGDVVDTAAIDGYVAAGSPAELSKEIVYTEVTAIGATDSAEYKAAKELNDWRLAHTEDNTLFPNGIENYTAEEIDAIVDAIENDVYVQMGAYTDEARAALDSIAAKYNLRLPESFDEITQKDLYDMTGEPDVLPLEDNTRAGIWYEGGSLAITNSAVTENGKSFYYDLFRSVRGMLSNSAQLVVEQEITEEWQYTTADGTTVTLDLGTNHSVLMAELPNSFVYVNIRGGTENNDPNRDLASSDTLTRSDLEAFAELIDFKTMDSIE